MRLVCLECNQTFGCYLVTTKIKCESVECYFAIRDGFCQVQSMEKSSGYCDKCGPVVLKRYRDERKKRNNGGT